jgi:hypothetical protein
MGSLKLVHNFATSARNFRARVWRDRRAWRCGAGDRAVSAGAARARRARNACRVERQSTRAATAAPSPDTQARAPEASRKGASFTAEERGVTSQLTQPGHRSICAGSAPAPPAAPDRRGSATGARRSGKHRRIRPCRSGPRRRGLWQRHGRRWNR